MGTNGLWTTVKPVARQINLMHHALASAAQRTASTDQLYTIGIDAYNIMAACVAANPTNPAKTFFYKLANMLYYPVQFIFVWDGSERPKEKRGHRVSATQLWGNVQHLVKAFGFAVWQAPGEAEAELARMAAAGIIHAVLSDDSDSLVFGATSVIRWAKTTDPAATIYVASEISQKLGLTLNGLVLYSILSGNDYDAGLRGCGASMALKIATCTQLADSLVAVCTSQSPEQARNSWSNTFKSWLSENKKNALLGAWHPHFPSIDTLRKIISPAVSDFTPEIIADINRQLHYPPSLVTLSDAYSLVFGGLRGAADVEFGAERLLTFQNCVFEPYIARCLYLPSTRRDRNNPNSIRTPLGHITLADYQRRVTQELHDPANSDFVFTQHQIFFNTNTLVHETTREPLLPASPAEKVSVWIPFLFVQVFDFGDKYIRSDRRQLAGRPSPAAPHPTGSRVLAALDAHTREILDMPSTPSSSKRRMSSAGSGSRKKRPATSLGSKGTKVDAVATSAAAVSTEATPQNGSKLQPYYISD
ncbi:XPGI domain-containing protein [Mycena kentingensis (nom. inval.)]|nr:XPGI domain-containing protein [Mycena kentingensis (nom. inval.)]